MAKQKENGRRGECFIEVQALDDFGRLCNALERIPPPIFAFRYRGKKILAIQFDVFMSKPVFYYTSVMEFHHFLAYRNSEGNEEVTLTNSPENSSYIYSPIIIIDKFPAKFVQGVSNGFRHQKYQSVKVQDLVNLAKICSYKTLYEERSIPIFSFPSKNKWALGSFAKIDDINESSIFFYLLINKMPINNFLKYSISKCDEALFVNKIGEHGFTHMKIIRLSEVHPLVRI